MIRRLTAEDSPPVEDALSVQPSGGRAEAAVREECG